MTGPEIYILDRNSLHSNFLKFQLALKKFNRVMVFHSVEECIYRLRKQAAPDYLITEFDLGDYNGLEFLRMAQKLAPQTSVIFFSSMDDEVMANQVLSEGAMDYIVKRSSLDSGVKELIRNLQFIHSEKAS